MSQGELGSLLAITQQRCSQLVSQGTFPVTEDGLLDPYRCIPAYIGTLKKQNDPAAERYRTAKAKLIERRIAREENETVKISEINEGLAPIISVFCSELHSVAAASTRDIPLREAIQNNINRAVARCKARLDAMADAAKSGRPLVDHNGAVDDED
ncbi:hypothetical protein [Bradyrhizobium sp. USDA 10063]